MRISRLITFASFTLGFVSALALPVVRHDTTRDDDLDYRSNHPNYDKVSINNNAMRHMQQDLSQHDRKVVEDYNKNTVAAELDKHPAAKSAKINHLAHIEGSADPKMHITATFKNDAGQIIPSRYGTFEKKGEKHHIYTDQLPKEYTQAMERNKVLLENNPEAKAKYEAELAWAKTKKEAIEKEAEKKIAMEEQRKKEAHDTHEANVAQGMAIEISKSLPYHPPRANTI